MPQNPAPPQAFALLTEASQRWVRSIDSLSDQQLAEDSLLPGWSRAHVAAHVALNGLALAGVLNGVAANQPVPMYASVQERNEGIEELVEAGPSDVRARTLESVTRFAEAAESFPQARSEDLVARVPGGPVFPAGAALEMRWREVEFHHADLGIRYFPADWPTEFAIAAISALTASPSPRPWAAAFRVWATDVEQGWLVGEDSGKATLITVSGDAATLAWWLSGRGDDGKLETDHGVLPEVPKL